MKPQIARHRVHHFKITVEFPNACTDNEALEDVRGHLEAAECESEHTRFTITHVMRRER